MSRHLTVSAVTLAIGQIVEAAASNAVPSASVSFERPDSTTTPPKVFVFMYQVLPNAAARNMELPVRYADGSAKQRPLLPLDLHYLISFVGDDRYLDSQRMLGSVASMLHAYPVISAEEIRAAKPSPLEPPLIDPSDDAIPIVEIRLTPTKLNLDELSKVWSVFFQTPYVLSIGYQASVALLEHDVAIRPPLPAQRSSGKSGMLANPVMDRIISQAGEYQPITIDSALFIIGKRLAGEQTIVHFVEADDEVVPDNVSDNSIALQMPASVQTVGAQMVRVLHRPWNAAPGDASDETRSNTASFVVHPKITSWALNGTTLDVEIAPPVNDGQKIRILLDELNTDSPAAHQLSVPTHSGPSTTSLSRELTEVGAGSYALRVAIDGIESRLDIDENAQTISPSLTLP